MSSVPTWFVGLAPGWHHGTAILRIGVARGQRREKPVTIWPATAEAETQRISLWQAIPSDQGLITREIRDLDERGDSIEVPMMRGLSLSGLSRRAH